MLKLLSMELPYKRIPKLKGRAPLVLLIVTLGTFISLCYPLLGYPLYLWKHFSKSYRSSFAGHEYSTNATLTEGCDLFSGEWVPGPDDAPYYTNVTCRAIHEQQNCMKYGRPDTGFMKWRWKPHGCALPTFDPVQFLRVVRGKSMAFVGDSLGRNQMQSLICSLSKVEYPIDVSYASSKPFKRLRYTDFDFTIEQFWSPQLLKFAQADADGTTHTGLLNLYLDELDDEWATGIEGFDYVIIGARHWFSRPTIYYENHKIVGCCDCLLNNVTNLPMSYGYRKAFRAAFRHINSLENFKGVTFLRTFTPSHFENGEWNEGGNCPRTEPFRSNETKLEGNDLEFYLTQVEEFRTAEKEGMKRGKRFRLFDITNIMLLRPDGHPGRYGWHATQKNDCLHWCLPGPIDAWNQFLLEMLKIENHKMNKHI